MKSTLKKAVVAAGGVALAAGVAGAVAAPANALTTTDAAYLAVLDHLNVPYATSSGAIQGGHLICTTIDVQGYSPEAIGWSLVGGGWTVADAGHTVGAAIAAYCPWDKGLVTNA